MPNSSNLFLSISPCDPIPGPWKENRTRLALANVTARRCLPLQNRRYLLRHLKRTCKSLGPYTSKRYDTEAWCRSVKERYSVALLEGYHATGSFLSQTRDTPPWLRVSILSVRNTEEKFIWSAFTTMKIIPNIYKWRNLVLQKVTGCRNPRTQQFFSGVLLNMAFYQNVHPWREHVHISHEN